MKPLNLMLALLLAFGCTYASEDLQTTIRSSVPVSDKVLDGLVRSGPDAVFEGQQSVPLATAMDKDMLNRRKEMMASLWGKLISVHGDPVGREFVRSEHIGATLVRNTYLLRFERNAFPVAVTLYQGRDGWIVTDVDTNASLDMLFTPVGESP